MIVHGDSVCAWVSGQTGGEYVKGSGQGIGIVRDDRIVCGVLFEHFNGRSVQIHVALEAGQRMTREWFRVLFGYAFDQLGVKKIIGLIDSENAQSLQFTRHIGFVDEATIKDAGKVADLHILTMTRQQCRFLE